MKTLQRIKNIVRSRKASSMTVVGGELLSELQKHLQTLDDRLEQAKEAKICAAINLKRWIQLEEQTQNLHTEDERKVSMLSRLEEVAKNSKNLAKLHYKSHQGKLEELEDIRKRVLQAIAMIEVENNVRSVTSMSADQSGVKQQTTLLEIETREIRRLLHTTDGLLEIVQ